MARPRRRTCAANIWLIPLGIDEPAPRLSWEMVDPRRRCAVQTAYRILVADDPATLDADAGNLWDTGKVVSDESIQIVYAGQPLRSRTAVWWKVQVWDKDGNPSPWSVPARWSMGLLEPADWHAKWIGDPTPASAGEPAQQRLSQPTCRLAGCAEVDHDRPGKRRDDRRRAALPRQAIQLVPGRSWLPVSGPVQDRGWIERGPRRRRHRDRPNAGRRAQTSAGEAQTYTCAPVRGRYVRLDVSRLRERNAGRYGVALAEIQVLANGENIAEHAEVTASDSVESGRSGPRGSSWMVTCIRTASRDWGQLAPPLLRKTFAVDDTAAIKRATVYVTALGLYELRLNGDRVGDHQLAPEWDRLPRENPVSGVRRDRSAAGGRERHEQCSSPTAGTPAASWLTGIVPAVRRGRSMAASRACCSSSKSSTATVTSSESCRPTIPGYLRRRGPLRVADLLDGEIYDAQREMPGCDRPGFDDSAWVGGRRVRQPGRSARRAAEPTDSHRRAR